MTVTIIETPASVELANKGLLSEPLWNRLVARIEKDESVPEALAGRIMDQALAFLQLCAAEPEGHYSPSQLVDVGWHTFILYTREYAVFCEKVAGHFIHHAPSDEVGVDYGTGNVARTVAALRSHGITVDEMLWTNPKRAAMSADCSSYCSGDSCSGGGGDGDSGCSH